MALAEVVYALTLDSRRTTELRLAHMAKPHPGRIKRPRAETVRGGSYRYTVHFEPAEEGGYVVKVPALGIATQGDTLEDARTMAEDLIRGYIESLRKHHEPIPREHEEVLTTHITVSLARA